MLISKLKNISLVLGTALLWSCSSSEEVLNVPQTLDHLEFSAVVHGQKHTRAIDTKWSVNDEIGVFAIPSGSLISENPGDEDNFNRRYVTKQGDGEFVVSGLLPIRLDGKNAKDIVAYYPYSLGTISGVHNLDVADQVDQEKIDLLYSNNVKGLKDNGKANLEFAHMLSKFTFKVKKGEGVDSFEGFAVESLSGLITEGSFSLDNATFTLSETKKDIVNLSVVDEGADVKSATAYLLPGQSLKDAVIQLKLGELSYKWKVSDVKNLEEITLVSGLSYTFKVTLTVEKNEIVLVIDKDGTVIKPWGKGHEDEDFPEIKPEDKPEDKEVVTTDVTKIELTADATQASFNIKANADDEWLLESDVEWITLSAEEGKGSAKIDLVIKPNETPLARIGKVSVLVENETLEVIINQEAAKAVEEVKVDQSSLDFTFDAADAAFNITAGENVAWTIKTENDWIKLSQTEGKGNAEIKVEVSANASSETRSGDIHVLSNAPMIEIAVIQQGNKSVEEVERVVLLEETFGIKSDYKAAKVGKDYPKLAGFDKFDNSGLSFTDESGGASMRFFNEVNSIFIPGNVTTPIVINNIDAVAQVNNMKDAKLVLSLGSSSIPKIREVLELSEIQIKVDGQPLEWSYKVDRQDVNDLFVDVEIDLPMASISTLEFSCPWSLGVRIANIKILGVK